jgi:hypothetical protein
VGRHAKHHPSAGEFIDANRWRVKPSDAAQRLAERDARLAADTRNDCQKFLGDPPPSRSALMQGSAVSPKRGMAWRVEGLRCLEDCRSRLR